MLNDKNQRALLCLQSLFPAGTTWRNWLRKSKVGNIYCPQTPLLVPYLSDFQVYGLEILVGIRTVIVFVLVGSTNWIKSREGKILFNSPPARIYQNNVNLNFICVFIFENFYSARLK